MTKEFVDIMSRINRQKFSYTVVARNVATGEIKNFHTILSDTNQGCQWRWLLFDEDALDAPYCSKVIASQSNEENPDYGMIVNGQLVGRVFGWERISLGVIGWNAPNGTVWKVSEIILNPE